MRRISSALLPMRPGTDAAVCPPPRRDDSRRAKPAAKPNRIEISDVRIMKLAPDVRQLLMSDKWPPKGSLRPY